MACAEHRDVETVRDWWQTTVTGVCGLAPAGLFVAALLARCEAPG